MTMHSDSGSPDTPDSVVPGSRTASPETWNEAAAMLARGVTMTAVAAHLGCARSTLWRALQRSERLRIRIVEEQRCLAVDAAVRFRGLHAAAVDAIEEAVRRGDLRAAFWVVDRLGLARIAVDEARAGIAVAEDAAAWGEGPPVDPALFAVDAPLDLEPGVLDEAGSASGAAPAETETEARTFPPARTSPLAPTPAPPSIAPPPATGQRATGRRATGQRATGPSANATPPLSCFTPLHGTARPPADDGGTLDLLKALPRTDAAWPEVQRGIRIAHAAMAAAPR